MKPYTVELVETGIMRVTWNGILNRDGFQRATEDRVRFADEHIKGNYVLIFDLKKAIITILDVRLTAWAANIDRRMIYTVIVGRSTISVLVGNMLGRLSRLKIEFCDTPDQALERACAVYAGQATG